MCQQPRPLPTLSKNIIEHVGKRGCKIVHIIGADPLTNLSKTFNLLEICINNKEIRNIYLYTNGYRINNFISYNDNYNLNLEKLTFVIQVMGHNNNLNNEITNQNGITDIVTSSLDLLKEHNIKFIIKIMICALNYNDIRDIVDFYKNIHSYLVIDWVYEDENTDYNYTAFLHKQIKNEVDNGINEISFFNNMEYHPCLVGKITLFENGNVGICPMMSNSTFGNILDTDFENILNKENLYPYWKSSVGKISQCKECEYRFTCKDCRAIENNYKEKDKFICVKNWGGLI